MSTVDILIPFYNAGDLLAAALASVKAQTFNDWNVILIDDGSTDSSKNIAQAFAKDNPGKCILLQSEKPQSGAAKSRNDGIKKARGKYIMCLDSDDSLEPFCVEQRLSVMQTNPELGWAVFNQYQVTPGAKKPYPFFNKPVKTREPAIAYFLQMLPAWQTMAPLWKTEVLQKMNGFDGSLYPMEDPDLHLRALLEDGLEMEINTDLPADCYYNVANKTDDKLVSFYTKDIEAKFLYLKKMVVYLPGKVSADRMKIYRKFIRKGFFIFLSTVLLSRLTRYKKEVAQASLLLKNENVLSYLDIIKVKVISFLYTNPSPVFKKMKLRGLVHKLFLARA